MNLLAPRVLGPLSECSRTVLVSNVTPGATVTLFVNRGGIIRRVGHQLFSNTQGLVPLDPGEELAAGDQVDAGQELAPDESPRSTDGPQVQTSVLQFDAAQVLTHLHQCSRGFALGGMRPGTTVQILQGGTVIGTGEARDGTASITVPDGLPAPATLVARQLICPKPPPPPPSSGYLFDSPLPPVLPFPLRSGQTLPAPALLQGLYACSRSVQVGGIEPGAEVLLEAVNGGWWASLGPSDQNSAWLPLPVRLRDGEEVRIHQEVAPHCELKFEKKVQKAGPQQKLAKPGLAQIDCNTTPSIYAIGLKPEADVEFSVVVEGVESRYRTSATLATGPVPAPPMPARAVVMVRQGECDVWSDWSDPRTANPLTRPPLQPKISRKLFSCQDAIPVENVDPLNGYLRVMSRNHGELCKVPAGGNTPVLSVAPSLTVPDDIWIEHHVCGFVAKSEAKPVNPRGDVVAGTIRGPLFDGDTTVILMHAVAGARIELWEETKNQLLQAARAPFADTNFVDAKFGGFGQLRAGWKVYAKTSHCGNFVQTQPSLPVTFKAPVLNAIDPPSMIAAKPGFTLKTLGSNFLSGATIQWNGANRTTTFVSATELHAVIPATDVGTVRVVPVRVVNPDGQASGTLGFAVNAQPPVVVGFDELLIQNCNANTLPGSPIHRPIHIYFRRTDLGPPGPWIPINDSPHDADYDENGTCPADSSVGARFSLDDGADYEVVCTDPLLAGCITGGPDEPACRRAPVITIHGKAGGGVKTIIVS
jgi:hypothetical protein